MRFSANNQNRGWRRGLAGFSLLELVIVIAILAILITVVRPSWETAKRRSKEVSLAASLHMMRQSISQYVADKGKLPESLDSLISAGYFGEIPKDPITEMRTWSPELGKLPGTSSIFDSGIRDIHSTSEAIAIDGTPYNTW